MRQRVRNNKVNQRERSIANLEAQQVLYELHRLNGGLNVGEMINVAVSMGVIPTTAYRAKSKQDH